MAKTISYTNVAPNYDNVRRMSEGNLGIWISGLIKYGGISRITRILEIGCGTGRFTVPLWKWTRAKVVGLDLSDSMLKIAREKEPSSSIDWRLGNAENLPFPDSTFDCVFMIYVLHHINSQVKALREIFRVLRPGGRVIIGTASYGLFRSDILYKIFPDLMVIDTARFPSIPGLKVLLSDAGFSSIESHYIKGQPAYLSKREYLEWVQQKPLSSFPLMSESRFEEGLATLRRKPPDMQFKQFFVFHQCVFVVGEKSVLK